MSSDKNILIICEGNDEKKLLEILFDVYPIKISFKIFSYGTNIYLLRKHIFENYIEKGFKIDEIDIISLLREYREDEVLKQKFTDILFIFDLEPQDPRFSFEHIVSMQEIFSESTNQGQLYLNYPMFESVLDFDEIPDPNYQYKKVMLETIPRNGYKNRVRRTSALKGIERINAENLPILMKQTIEKFEYISKDDNFNYLDLLINQIQLINNENSVWVINTSILFLKDFNHELFLEYINYLELSSRDIDI